MKKVGAFFDIDGTLCREGLITETFKKLVKSDIIEQQLWYNEVREKYLKWNKRLGNYDDYLLKMAEIYIDAIKGLYKTQIEFVAKKVIEHKGDKVYIFTRDKIAWHLEQGHKVITISGSPSELVSEIASKYMFHDYIGSEYVINNQGIYTGEVKPMWDSESKEKAIKYFVKKYNIDLDKSYAYGDTAGDFTMLKSVAYPVAMNPTKELINKIKQDPSVASKAKIVVERKDSIYHLNPSQV